MKAVRLHGTDDIRLDDIPEPGAPGPDQALVAPLWAGICGTDIKEYTGHGLDAGKVPHPRTGAARPLVLGHEFSARVIEVGANIRDVAVGDEVAIMPLQHCGNCYYCRRGHYTACETKSWTGLSSPWGGFAERAIVEGYQLTPLKGLSALAGAVIEPAAVAVNAAERSGVVSGSTVFIAGAGPIGILSIMAVRAAGAAAVYVSEVNELRAELAASLGAELIPADRIDDATAYLHDRVGRFGIDVALDCAGRPAALTACLDVVRPGGNVGVPAGHAGAMSIDVRQFWRKELFINGAVGYTQDAWERTVALARAGLLPVERAVTSKIALDDILKDGFDVLTQPSAEVKILVRVNE